LEKKADKIALYSIKENKNIWKNYLSLSKKSEE
jgi:hypothetical protein